MPIGSYEKTKGDKKSLYSIEEFVNILADNGYFEREEDDPEDNAQIITDELLYKHKSFFAQLKYLENGTDNKKYTAAEMKAINNHKTVMFMKNNNFINHFMYGDLPYHATIHNRKAIGSALRDKVWKKEYGHSNSGQCPVKYCKNIVRNDIKFGFQCGHVTSNCNRGKSSLDNLRPICADCNAKMSSTNWGEYEDELVKKKYWSKDHCDDETGNCEECKKKITFEDANIKKKQLRNKKIRIKLVCNKCIRVSK